MGNFNLFGIGPLELFFILAIALIVLGPERLPQVAREIIKFVGQLRSLYRDLTSQLNSEFGDLEELQSLRRDLQELNTERLLGALGEEPESQPQADEKAKKPAATTVPRKAGSDKSAAAGAGKTSPTPAAKTTGSAKTTAATQATGDSSPAQPADPPQATQESSPAPVPEPESNGTDHNTIGPVAVEAAAGSPPPDPQPDPEHAAAAKNPAPPDESAAAAAQKQSPDSTQEPA